jgi:hypothetical protein
MTDPLRPFADAIRLLWRARQKRLGRAEDTTAPGSSGPQRSEQRSSQQPEETLRSRLQARICGLDSTNSRKMRETFVETVLLWELGDQLAPDPAFGELVLRVSEQLESDRSVGDRLHRALLDLARQSKASARD